MITTAMLCSNQHIHRIIK